jgi:cytochrome b561
MIIIIIIVIAQGDGMVGARDLPNIGSLHFSHALALVGIMVVLLLWRMSRRQRGGSTPTHRSSNPGNSRAYRRIFGR